MNSLGATPSNWLNSTDPEPSSRYSPLADPTHRRSPVGHHGRDIGIPCSLHRRDGPGRNIAAQQPVDSTYPHRLTAVKAGTCEQKAARLLQHRPDRIGGQVITQYVVTAEEQHHGRIGVEGGELARITLIHADAPDIRAVGCGHHVLRRTTGGCHRRQASLSLWPMPCAMCGPRCR